MIFQKIYIYYIGLILDHVLFKNTLGGKIFQLFISSRDPARENGKLSFLKHKSYISWENIPFISSASPLSLRCFRGVPVKLLVLHNDSVRAARLAGKKE